MKQILLLVFSLWWGYTYAQTNVSSKKEQSTGTQQAQENDWAKQLFNENYSKQQYEKHKGKIKVNGDTFNFEKVVFVVRNTNPTLKTIISSGLLYPKLFEVDLKILDHDTLTIQHIEELAFLNTEPTSKKFRLMGSKKNLLNPTVYFIELTNAKATSKTSLSTFIKGSTLTFFTEAWTQI